MGRAPNLIYDPLSNGFAKAGPRRKAVVISGRAKRVILYTASLLIAPMPIMPFEKGTRGYVLGVMMCGAVLTLSSLSVVQGERRLHARGLLGNKLLAASLITLLFGALMFVGSVLYLLIRWRTKQS